MAKYEKPIVEIIEIETEDIITVSNSIIDIDGGGVDFIEEWMQ